MLPWVIFDNQRYIAGYGDFFAFGEIKQLGRPTVYGAFDVRRRLFGMIDMTSFGFRCIEGVMTQWC